MSDPLGGLPQAPPPSETYRNVPPDRGPAPSTVVSAVRVMILAAVLVAAGLVVLLATQDQLRRRIKSENAFATDQTINSALVIRVVITIVVVALFVSLAKRVRDGKNSARIVTWVIAGLGVLSALSQLTQVDTGFSRTVTVLSGLLYLAIIVLLALTPSNRYFRKVY